MLNRFLALAAVLILALPEANGATRNWIGPTGNGSIGGNWSTTVDWSPAGVPAAGDDVNIIGTATMGPTITYDYTGAAISLGSLNINAGGTNFMRPAATLSMSANTL